MPADLAGLSAVRGGIYGLVICRLSSGAIWFYQLTVPTRPHEGLRRVFGDRSAAAACVSGYPHRILLRRSARGMAGFGAPVAITATMILSRR